MPAGKPKPRKSPDAAVTDYRHAAKRKHIPPAGLAASGQIKETPKLQFAYNPHLPPKLRADPTGKADALPELLRDATTRKLTRDEARLLAEALRNREPWLEWSGKQEKKAFGVEPVALHIHERISAQAILKVAARQDVQRDLFADPQLSYQQAVQFYEHDVDWANRMILGDSLQVMASLARRENLAGKVQMIYLDPPYGIKFASNFQPEIGRRDVKDKESDLTREPEMVKAYRDTWTLGVHSYLAYLRDRLILARELLADSGSIFVQISDENLHRVRAVMDEIFGPHNLCAVIPFSKTSGQTPKLIASVADYLLWYAKDIEKVKYHQLFVEKEAIENPTERCVCVETPEGTLIDLTVAQKASKEPLPRGSILRLRDTTSQTGGESSRFPFEFWGRTFVPSGKRGWSTTDAALTRAAKAERLYGVGDSLR